jgi:hypothetical protein
MSTFGTVLFKEGNFFVDVGGKHELIPVNQTNELHMKELVGKKIEVVFSEPQRFIAGLVLAEEKPVRKIIKILCNVPRPDFQTLVFEESARIQLARQMLDAKVLSKEAFEKIAARNITGQKAAE